MACGSSRWTCSGLPSVPRRRRVQGGTGMSTHIEGHPAAVGFKVSRMARLVAVGAVLFAFCAAVAVPASSAGQASRPTDAAVDAQRRAAVHLAVVRAVAAKGAADHVKRLRIVAR